MEKEKILNIDEIHAQASEDLQKVADSQRPNDESTFLEDNTVAKIKIHDDDKD